jgi:hypothetical protein
MCRTTAVSLGRLFASFAAAAYLSLAAKNGHAARESPSHVS